MSKIHSAIIVEKSILENTIDKLNETYSVVDYHVSTEEEIKSIPQLAPLVEYHRINKIYYTVIFVREVDADEMLSDLLYVFS